ncbi:MAG: site-specific integrase, partial [Mesorhizobium sp.]
IPVVTNRDLRRTWKTLAGKAGLSKEIRDRLQNHTLQDVSSKSYDRWNYMPEKRAAMARWDKFVRDILVKKKRKAAFKEAA